MKDLRYFVLLLLITVCSACSNEEAVPTLSGLYTEASPNQGRSQLNFIDGNTVLRIEPEGTTEDEFNYEVVDGVIKLTPTWSPSLVTQFEINIESETKFEIEDLYPTNGMRAPIFMTFEK